MGILDNASPLVKKACAGCVLLSVFGAFIAMCVTAPSGYITGAGQEKELEELDTGDTAWMMVSAAIVLLMTPGVAFFYGGMSQHKNVVSTIMQSFIPLAIIPILWALLGFGLAFGESPPGSSGVIGNPAQLGGLMYGVGAAPLKDLAATIPMSVFWVFQLTFAIITPALITGSIADRVNPSALCIFIGLWHLVVYCPMAHMVWHPTGVIRVWGVLDFAGGTVVHMSSGYAALIAAIYMGRSLKAPADQESGMFHDIKEPANVPIVMLGTALLWFGWFGFNAGSAGGAGFIAGQAFITTQAAAASSMLTFMLMDVMFGRKMRATGACIGAVIGLVCVTPAAGFINIGAAFIFGVVGAVVCSCVLEGMERWGSRYVDDCLDVFAVHGVGGTVGMILTALFSTVTANSAAIDGALYGNWMELAKVLLVLVIIVPWFFAATWACLFVTDKIITLRVSDLELIEGLDVSKHGERALSVHVMATGLDGSVNGSVHGSAHGARKGDDTVSVAAV